MTDIRRKGLAAFGVALACAGVLAALVHAFGLLRWRAVVFLLAVPVAIALAGLAQGVSGVRFSQLSARWDGLRGWQRGVLGLLLVLAFCALLFAALLVFVLATGQ